MSRKGPFFVSAIARQFVVIERSVRALQPIAASHQTWNFYRESNPGGGRRDTVFHATALPLQRVRE